MSEANGEYPPVSGSAGRPDDGNWRMLSSREREYLAKVESEARRADQLGINCRWLVAQLDEIHAALCPGHIGTWQDRAQKAVEAAKIISQNNQVEGDEGCLQPKAPAPTPGSAAPEPSSGD